MATVKSTWAASPITLDGTITNPEWSNAGEMAIPGGFLMVKNDNHYLYLALDLVVDLSADPGVDDYFWLTVDTGGDSAITPNVDVNYGIYPTTPVRIGRQYYLGPGAWTTLLDEPSTAAAVNGFGPSIHSRASHRIWEMRLPLAEIGMSNLGEQSNATVRFGLRVASSKPDFTFDFPANFYKSFDGLHSILLALMPDIPAPADAVFSSVGLIPAGDIKEGYATTPPTYSPGADDAAFGGSLRIIGNPGKLKELWDKGARKYIIQHQSGTDPFSPLLQSWRNINQSTNVLESFTWDSKNMYPLFDPVDPERDYSIDHLLIEWHTLGSKGLHTLKAEFFDESGTHSIAKPDQTLQLMIDNNLPRVEIVEILHGGKPAGACAMEKMASQDDGLQFKITVKDAEGHLGGLRLQASWGHGGKDSIYQDSYGLGGHRNDQHKWEGVESLVVLPFGKLWSPKETCAHQFTLTGASRVTNGYGNLGSASDTYHLTLIKADAAPQPRITQVHRQQMLGQTTAGSPLRAGTTPKELGSRSLSSK